MQLRLFMAIAAAAVVIGGCSSLPEIDYESDITVEELEQRRQKSTDPEKRYANAKSYVMRQEIIVNPDDWLEDPTSTMVEMKYDDDNRFKMTTFKDNKPLVAIIVNGENCWKCDYSAKENDLLSKDERAKVLTFQKLSTPVTSVRDIFSKVDIAKTEVDGKYFYKLSCSNGDGNVFHIYHDPVDFLPRRMRVKFTSDKNVTLDYDSQITRYSLFAGVRIPDEAKLLQDGVEAKTKVLSFQLNVDFPDNEFRPPIF
ncbi:MAG: hypothetical protein MJ025_03335 [Victivallaceae bacterium]|nr:hypothetical protein [Victivallaceae bacterium]